MSQFIDISQKNLGCLASSTERFENKVKVVLSVHTAIRCKFPNISRFFVNQGKSRVLMKPLGHSLGRLELQLISVSSGGCSRLHEKRLGEAALLTEGPQGGTGSWHGFAFY